MPVQKIVQVPQVIDWSELKLRSLYKFSERDAINFLVNATVLRNEINCDISSNSMNLVKRSDKEDLLQWECRNNKKRCSRKSIPRHSFFENARVPFTNLVILFYMWAYDFDNKQIVRELELDGHTVVDYLGMCREICQNYCHNQEQLGGEAKYIEIYESCIAKQKQYRGRPRRGTTQWVFDGIEFGEGGLAFAFRVPDRKKKELYPIIRDHILPRTTIVSDDWPAYRKLGPKLGRPMG